MYDKDKKRWTAAEAGVNRMYVPDEQPSKEDELRERFEEADRALAKAKPGTENAEAVYLMEKTAKDGSADACFAMAQLFEYGWAVSKSKKQARYWYDRAAKAGSAEAAEIIAKLNAARRNRIAAIAIIVIAAIAIVAIVAYAAGWLLPGRDGKDGKTVITLPGGVELFDANDSNESARQIKRLIDEYDDESMAGEGAHTNRILLVYNGAKLDLSAYKVVDASRYGDYIVLQFKNAQDAQDCMDYLEKLEGTVAVDYDTYTGSGSAADPANDSSADPAEDSAGLGVTASGGYSHVYHSNATGCDYYSWGAQAMGFDEYSAFLQKILPDDHRIVVGVIDSGIEPQDDTGGRILAGFDYCGENSDGLVDTNGHGTHVSGTILDCTQGLNIYVESLRVVPTTFFGSPNVRGQTTTSLLTSAVQGAVDEQVGVINVSIGGLADESDDVYEYYIECAIDAGIPFVTSAGNDAADANYYTPARVDRCITVSAIDEYGDPAYFTNYGSVVDVCAPGVDVLSYFPQPEGLKYLSGTSMASPHVAALTAMIKLEFDDTADVISFYVKSYCDDIGDDTDYFGSGLPDGRLLVE